MKRLGLAEGYDFAVKKLEGGERGYIKIRPEGRRKLADRAKVDEEARKFVNYLKATAELYAERKGDQTALRGFEKEFGAKQDKIPTKTPRR